LRGLTLREEVKQQQRGLQENFEVGAGGDFLKFFAREGPISFAR
jgi:hypothetical protein